jgi:hypothetical protein
MPPDSVQRVPGCRVAGVQDAARCGVMHDPGLQGKQPDPRRLADDPLRVFAFRCMLVRLLRVHS